MMNDSLRMMNDLFNKINKTNHLRLLCGFAALREEKFFNTTN